MSDWIDGQGSSAKYVINNKGAIAINSNNRAVSDVAIPMSDVSPWTRFASKLIKENCVGAGFSYWGKNVPSTVFSTKLKIIFYEKIYVFFIFCW